MEALGVGRLAKQFFLFFAMLLVQSCFWTKPMKQGVRPGYESYIPARIGVFNTVLWPFSSDFSANPPKEFLDECDKRVGNAFHQQPYMRGYTPKRLKTYLTEANSLSLYDKRLNILNQWIDQFSSRPDLLVFYQENIKSQKEWGQWLRDLSLNTNYIDAVLLPFLVSFREEIIDDRGIDLGKRQIALFLLLLDTNDGTVIWSQTKWVRKYVTLPDSSRTKVTLEASYPPWTMILDQTFTEDLWKDFPGRITNTP